MEAAPAAMAETLRQLEASRAALQRSEAELRLVVDNLPVLVAFVDPSLVYRVVNTASRDWFGRPAEEVIGRRMPDVLGEAGFQIRQPFIAQALAGETPVFDLDWPWPDGRSRRAEVRFTPRCGAAGSIDGFYIFVQDVTAQQRMQELLTARADLLEQEVVARTAERNRLWQTTNDLMGVAGLDGYLKSVNPAWMRILGWTEQELLTRPFTTLIDPADHAETAGVVARLSAGEAVTDFVDHVIQKDGTRRIVMWAATPDGDVFHIVGRDLTAQRRIEDQLRQSQKMEAVGQLTGGLAHDFNNLLTGIAGSLELLQTRVAQGRTQELDRYIGAAQGAAQRAAALTHRLLAFSRRQTLDPRPTDAKRLVNGLEELVRRTVGPAIAVRVTAEDGAWPTLVDPSQLENAVLNLCINARDAMPEGGRLTIALANRWLDGPAAAAREVPAGPYLSLSVSDTGTGMAPDVAARAFDPFFTTKPIGQGTGLGLSMIYGFVRQSGGQARIVSAVGQGTTVCLDLPRHVGEVDPPPTPPPPAAPVPAGGGETVLVVDDEPSMRLLIVDVLEGLGYAAIAAADGAAGLALLRSDRRVDLLVTDIGLPGGLTGRQMADAARVVRPDLKVLFITGYAEDTVVGSTQGAPGMHLMTKPFAMHALAARVAALIGAAPPASGA